MKTVNIKIVNKIGDEATLRDCTIGSIYEATEHEEGSITPAPHSSSCTHDTLCFTDDAGDMVSIWRKDTTFKFELAEEEVMRDPDSVIDKQADQIKMLRETLRHVMSDYQCTASYCENQDVATEYFKNLDKFNAAMEMSK